MDTQAHILAKNVRRKPWFIDVLPWIGKGTSTALYPNVWLAGKVYDDLVGPSPQPYNLALLRHEQEHVLRMKQTGTIRWSLKYILSPKYRFEEELTALRPQFAILKQYDCDGYLEYRAKRLSGWLYLWPVSYNAAFERLIKLWHDVL